MKKAISIIIFLSFLWLWIQTIHASQTWAGFGGSNTRWNTGSSQTTKCRKIEFGCEAHKTTPSYTTSSYKNFESAEATITYKAPSDKVLLDNVSCTQKAIGTKHTTAKSQIDTNCNESNGKYYSTAWKNGTCTFSSTNNTFTKTNGFNQYWDVNREQKKHTGSSCIVEGRYATADKTVPTITITNDWGFSNAADKWCNIEAYSKSNYTTSENPSRPGCEYYKTQNGAWGTNPDLLWNFSFDVQDENSGLAAIDIQIWVCPKVTYQFPTKVESIVKDKTSAKWIATGLEKSIKLSANKGFSYGWTNYPSIISKISELPKLSISRLDQCLWEGRNYFQITAYDNARALNWKDHAPNIRSVSSQNKIDRSKEKYFINIDNSGVSAKISGDEPTSHTWWLNRTASWTFQFDDKTWGTYCKNYTTWASKNCTNTLPDINAVWGSNNSWGTYNLQMCDGEELLDEINGQCEWTCNPWYAKSNGWCVVENTYKWVVSFDNAICNAWDSYQQTGTITCQAKRTDTGATDSVEDKYCTSDKPTNKQACTINKWVYSDYWTCNASWVRTKTATCNKYTSKDVYAPTNEVCKWEKLNFTTTSGCTATCPTKAPYLSCENVPYAQYMGWGNKCYRYTWWNGSWGTAVVWDAKPTCESGYLLIDGQCKSASCLDSSSINQICPDGKCLDQTNDYINDPSNPGWIDPIQNNSFQQGWTMGQSWF